jgi:translocator protein
MRPVRPWLALVVSLLLVAAVAVIGSRFAPGSWYAELSKPAWTPPSAVFGPVWTVLYILMALAAWKVWIAVRRIDGALTAYVVQLVLNGLWSWLFFGLHRIDLALVGICALALAIAVTLVLFWRRDRLAGVLLLPYLVWVGYAAALNLTLWRLNA